MQKKSKPRSMRWIVIWIMGISLLIFIVLLNSLFYQTISRMLLEEEDRSIQEELYMIGEILQITLGNVSSVARDWAFSDEMADYAEGANEGFTDGRLAKKSPLQNHMLNFMVVKDRDGRDVHVQFYDYHKGEEMEVPQGFTDALAPIAEEVIQGYDASGQDAGREGFLYLNGTPYYLCAMPILREGENEKPVGTLYFGNIWDSGYFKRFSPGGSERISLTEGTEADPIDGDSVLHGLDDEAVTVTIPMLDINGVPLLLKVSRERSAYNEGRNRMMPSMVLLVVVQCIFFTALYYIIIRLVLRPIEHLCGAIEKVEEAGAIDIGRNAGNLEFAVLGASINNMLERLRQSDKKAEESDNALEVLKNILNGMDAYLYVSDAETDEILFINDKMIRHFGLDETVVGQTCWKVLQSGFEHRCDFCPNYKLDVDPGGVVEWEELNTATGRYYKNTDSYIEWTGNRKVHLQHSVDITELKAAEEALTQRLDQEQLMSSVSRSFISTGDMTVQVDNALRMTGEFMDVDRIRIGIPNPDTRQIEFPHIWSNPSKNVMDIRGRSVPFGESHPLWNKIVKEHAGYFSSNDADAGEALAYQSNIGVKAFINIPIYVEESLWGVLCVDECTEKRIWTGSDINLVQLISSVISGVVTRGVTEEQLTRMSSIVDSSPQYINYINKEGKLLYLNQGMLDITGYSREELMAEGVSILYSEETKKLVFDEYIPEIIAQGRLGFEMPILRKDGEERIMSYSTFTTDAERNGIGVIASDITEKRRLERELIAAKEQAEQSNQAKSGFLSRMSHEMRTPMNAIIGMTSIAQATRDTERRDYCLDRIDNASRHLLGVINDVLDMSKIEANKFDLSDTEFDFERMLQNVTNVITFRIEEKNQTFLVKIDKDIPSFIVGDEQRLAQVITNLLSNAVKFTPEEGTVTLSARLLDEADGLCTLQIEVSDTGIGISREQQERLFQSFEQADGGITRRFGGTGLGLVISKSIVEMMGGAIWIESELDHGATFLFTIKAQRGTMERKNQLADDVDWTNLSIMLVDDASEVREYFSDFAKSMGIACQVAADGFEAWNLLEQNRRGAYDIVFVDWKMPGMDGIELTRKIRTGMHENVLIVMISATEWSVIEERAKSAGVNGFIPKPLFASVLVDCINQYLGKARSGKAGQDGEYAANCFAGYRILLAEDVEVNREIVIALLEDTGIAIECAENGLVAYEKFAADPALYDMIYMDIHMPVMDGFTATKKIRASGLERASTIPIVAMTANVFREDVEECLAAGMNDHVGKPIDLDEVMEKLKQYLPPFPRV